MVLFFRFDWRLKFVNLRNDEKRKNTVGEKEREKLWIPNLIFENSVRDYHVKFQYIVIVNVHYN